MNSINTDTKSVKYIYKIRLFRINKKIFSDPLFLQQSRLEDLFFNVRAFEYDNAETFKELVKDLYASFSEKKNNKIEDCITEIDITNFVTNFSLKYNISDANTCNLTISPICTVVGNSLGILKNTFSSDSFAGSNAIESMEQMFNEGDVIFIEFGEYDYTNKKIVSEYSKEYNNIEKRNLSKDEKNTFKNKLNKTLLSPYFLGFITKINNNENVNNVNTLSISCFSLMKVFNMTSIVTNQALQDSFAKFLENSDIIKPEYFTVWESRFSGLNATEIIEKLFKEIFLIQKINLQGDVPIFSYFLNPFETLYKSNKFHFFSMTFFIIFYIYNRILNADELIVNKQSDSFTGTTYPLLIFEDYFISKKPINSTFIKRDSAVNNLKPYLLMNKGSFSLFQSTYSTPTEILSTIREQTFLEFFETKQCFFNLRMPRYNDLDNIVEIPEINIKNANVDKTDSALYSMVALQNVAPLIGTLQLPNRVYFNKLLAFRYGLRMPKILKNVNVTTNQIGDLFARLISDMGNARTRTATIEMVPMVDLNVGMLVVFRTKDVITWQVKLYIGYIESIDEKYNVGGESTQTLTLTYVRECSKTDEPNVIDRGLVPSLAVTQYLFGTSDFKDKLDLLKIYEENSITIINKLKQGKTKEYMEYINSLVAQKKMKAMYYFRNIMNIPDISKALDIFSFVEQKNNLKAITKKNQFETASYPDSKQDLQDKINDIDITLKYLNDLQSKLSDLIFDKETFYNKGFK